MRIPGWKSLRREYRWLRSRFSRGILILGYHRIDNYQDDIFSLCVRPENFAEQLAILRDKANPISLAAAVRCLEEGEAPSNGVVLTFDDGYVDNLSEALPLLEEYDIPATVFVTTGYLGQMFWWDELAQIILESEKLPDQMTFHHDGSDYCWQLNDFESSDPSRNRKKLVMKLYQFFCNLNVDERRELIPQLYKWSNLEPSSQLKRLARAMTRGEVKEIADSDLISIGSHSVTHPILADIPIERQRQEIELSKYHVEAIIGDPITSFSYPNGSHNKITLNLLKRAGYSSACASFGDVAWKGSDVFNLPRFWVQDWGGDQFSRWLHRWLRG